MKDGLDFFATVDQQRATVAAIERLYAMEYFYMEALPLQVTWILLPVDHITGQYRHRH